MEEVSETVFPLCGDKAPGSDGFSIDFYMNFGISILKAAGLMKVFDDFMKMGRSVVA